MSKKMEKIRCQMYNSYYYIILKRFTRIDGENKSHILKKLSTIGWKFDIEPMMGTFVFTKQFNDVEVNVYATPYWEEISGVSIEISCYSDNDTEIHKTPEPIELKKPTGDSNIDSFEYFDAVSKILKEMDLEYSKDFEIVKINI